MTKFLILFTVLLSVNVLVGQTSNDTLPQNKKIGIFLHYGKLFPLVKEKFKENYNGYGMGVIIRYPTNSVFSVQSEISYYQINGVDPQPYPANLNPLDPTYGLVETLFNEYRYENGHPDGYWFPLFQNRMLSAEVSLSLNLIKGINYFFQKKLSWNLAFQCSMGVMHKDIYLNLYDESDQPYIDLIHKLNFTSDKFDTVKGRQELRNNIKELYDDSFETKNNFSPKYYFSTSYGITLSKRVFKHIDFGINYKYVNYSYNDNIKNLHDRTFNYLATRDVMFRSLNLHLGYCF